MATATTSSDSETTKVKLRLIIDKRANKVLFAEAEKDFVDILFNLLYMPFGSVTRLLRDAGMPQACPRPVSVERKLYSCRNNHPYVTTNVNTRCLQCSRPQDDEVRLSNIALESEGGIVQKSIAYTVTDDLSVIPGSVILGIDLLQGNIKDTGALKERAVDIGPDEVLELLSASMQTNEALTTVFLPREEEVCGMKMTVPHLGPQSQHLGDEDYMT
ncbi:hypothetical protein CISIN_1g042433mg [Citrus sinensis]|uniref:DUF674 domain-containing protein n=1 Tax=Citrus sinensis TaxID=2711 RepID=A0A067DJL0_CITSI|nr:hypothetical protein CISIN_1g042433mg [Citrus sinensis]